MLDAVTAICLGLATTAFHSMLLTIMLTVAAGVCLGILAAAVIINGVSRINTLTVRREIDRYRGEG
jgi:hypothetical protein